MKLVDILVVLTIKIHSKCDAFRFSFFFNYGYLIKVDNKSFTSLFFLDLGDFGCKNLNFDVFTLAKPFLHEFFLLLLALILSLNQRFIPLLLF